jgi:hypothetical protein
MKAYEATWTIDGKWTATVTGGDILVVLDEIVSFYPLNPFGGGVKAKEIHIKVKEI